MQKETNKKNFFLQKQNEGKATYQQQHSLLATWNATPQTH